ncbi:hypothetical protein RB6864 [Rhodopirellula baltica SH 1]|uniref:Uncharacterized protein n=1 Tax=Rhodopirellula baltica (strain DSM 10527 / NCIMB 13988 / SH1) TaxID=243090 RepID=Q7UPL2_RHOBA|nr:hypothetical protein RB6864 [Rhodopirellula baltica SH 1]
MQDQACDDCDWQMVFEASTEIISILAAATAVDGEPTACIIGGDV